ncbi:MAG: asparagine synthase-related protein [Bacteroidales bacterium]
MKITIFKDIETSLVEIDKNQKDYNYKSGEHLFIMVFGYPYYTKSDNWLTANDVENFYSQNNLNYIHEIDGIYSIIILDKKAGLFQLITDRYGIYKPYYFRDGDKIVISESFEEIVKDWPELEMNTNSIIEYFNYGYKLGEKTHFTRIKMFLPASVYKIGSTLEIKPEKYWDLFDISEDKKITREEFRLQFNEHIRKSMNLAAKISLPLTGGRDSRIILSAALPYKEKLHCYTHGPEYHTDVKQAMTICNHLQLKHEYYKIDDEFGKELPERAKGSSGFLNGHMSFFDYLHVKNSFEKEAADGNILLSGIMGNQLYRHHPIGNATLESGTTEDIAKLIYRQIPSVFSFRTNLSNYYGNLFKGLNSQNINQLIINSIKQVLDGSSTAKKPIDFTRYFMLNTYLSNSATNTLRFTGKYFKVIGAFFHKDLLKQFKFMELNEMIGADLHEYIIEKNNKYLGELNYYNSGRVIKYLKLITNKILFKLFKTSFFNHPELANYHYWLRKYHVDFLRDLLNPDKMYSAELFNKEELTKLVDKYLANKLNLSGKNNLLIGFSIERIILNLISFELWLRDIGKNKKITFSPVSLEK